jgi:hypothetical protein
MQCALYSKLGAKYSAHPTVYAMGVVHPDMYNAFTAPYIQASIFSWTCLRRYWRYVDNSMRVILKIGGKCSAHPPAYAMWTVVPDIYNVISAPHIYTSLFSWTYLRCYWRYVDNSIRVILQAWYQIQLKSSSLRYVNCGPDHIQCDYSSAYLGYNIQLNESAVLLEIYRHVEARYTANYMPSIARIIQFTLCELWSRTHTK